MRETMKLILAVAIVINLAALAFAAIDPEDIIGIWTSPWYVSNPVSGINKRFQHHFIIIH